MADTFPIESSSVIRPTSITLIRKDPTPTLPTGLSASERIRRFIEAVTLVASTRRDPDKFRVDVTTSQKHSRQARFTTNPVPRGNVVTDHSIIMPDVLQFTGFITETPFINFTADDLGLRPESSRVQDYLRLLDEFFESREPLFMASSIRNVDGMGITKLTYSKDADTGLAVEINMTLQQILFVDAVEDEPIPQTLNASLGFSPIEIATSTAG